VTNEQAVELATNRALVMLKEGYTFNNAVGWCANAYNVQFSSIVKEMHARKKAKQEAEKATRPKQYNLF
jgi:hypothetical protein